MKGISLKDLPTFFQTTDPNDDIFNLAMESAETASQASAFGIHTFDALEQDVLNALSTIFSHIYTMGPLHLWDTIYGKKNWSVSNGLTLNNLVQLFM
ncbi:hypothetical protein CsSME_00048478 [Camellia sinensis var. sinensis]